MRLLKPIQLLAALVAIGAVIIAPACLALESPSFRFLEKAGPHGVGLAVVEQYDHSRTFRRATDALGHSYTGERARPIQTLVWYPAEHNGARPMTYGGYVDLWATETRFGHPRMPIKAKQWLEDIGQSVDTSLWAVRDSRPESGRFPVVIYSPGGWGESWDNVELCEYLASHGYVVIAGPMMGEQTRQVPLDVAGVNAAARDISFLIGYAQTRPDTDMSSIAVAGMSWGGIANLFAAARDSRIDALVSLDGSMRYFPGVVRRAGDVHPEDMTIPLLALNEQSFAPERSESVYDLDGPGIFDAWTHGDLIFARMLTLTHGFLTSAFPRNTTAWKGLQTIPWVQGDYGPQDVNVGYAWMARYTLEFLNAYLKHDAVAMAFLKRTPAENGVPQHILSASYRAGSGVPASFDGLRAEAGRRGFDQLPAVYAQLLREKPDFKPDELVMSDWAEELLDEDHPAEALAVLRLESDLYPKSPKVEELLGDAQRRLGMLERGHGKAISGVRSVTQKG